LVKIEKNIPDPKTSPYIKFRNYQSKFKIFVLNAIT
jgi:hypothetical protein